MPCCLVISSGAAKKQRMHRDYRDYRGYREGGAAQIGKLRNFNI